MKLLPLFLSLAVVATAEPLDPEQLAAEIPAAHPELQFYREELTATRASARAAAARPAPELAVELGHKRIDGFGSLSAEGVAWSVSLSQTFDWPGRLALRKSLANADVALAEVGVTHFEAALRARLRTLAYGLQAAQVQADAVREVADRYAALKEVFLARDPAGLTPQLETRVIEAQELALQRRATTAALAVQATRVELNQLRGAPPAAPLEIAPRSLHFNAAPAPDALLAAARENNFEFLSRKLELEQQGFAVRLAQHEAHPSFTVSPFYSQEEAGDRESIAGVGLSLPLPVGGRARAGRELAESRQRQATAAVQRAELELERDVLAAAAAFAARREEAARWSPQAAARFREAAALADRHYRLGAVPLATYVELQNAYLDALESLLATQRDALETGLRLQLLTGLDFRAVEVRP